MTDGIVGPGLGPGTWRAPTALAAPPAPRWLLALATVMALAACGSPSDPESGAGTPAAVTAASGDQQPGVVGERLPDPVSAKVVDRNGDAVAGVTVTWEVTEGEGTVEPPSGATDAAGVASTLWTLGPAVGIQGLSASVAGLPPLAFAATGQAGPPDRIVTSLRDLILVLEEGRDQGRIEAVVLDRYDNEIGGHVTWSVPDPHVATVDATGLVRALGAGYSSVQARIGEVVGGTSLIVENPVPALGELRPATAGAGSPDLAVQLFGTGFVRTSQVLWNGTPRPSTFVSSTTLRAQIPAGDLTAAGTATVEVRSATPGGGTTAPLAFVVEPPAPSLPVTSAAASRRR